MEREIYRWSFFVRIISYFLGVFFIYGIILTIAENDLQLLFVHIFGLLFSIIYHVIYHVKYIFENGKIIIKYPFIKAKEYFIKDIIGFEFSNERTQYLLIIYFNETKIKMEVSGKKFKEKAKQFAEEYYEIICKKVIDIIETKGFEIKIQKDTYVFYNNHIKISGKHNKIYYYDKDIKDVKYFEIVDNFKRLDIITNDNYTIKLLSNKCKSGIGLFEYLMKIKSQNVA
jgi:hypothetical protein